MGCNIFMSCSKLSQYDPPPPTPTSNPVPRTQVLPHNQRCYHTNKGVLPHNHRCYHIFAFDLTPETNKDLSMVGHCLGPFSFFVNLGYVVLSKLDDPMHYTLANMADVSSPTSVSSGLIATQLMSCKLPMLFKPKVLQG